MVNDNQADTAPTEALFKFINNRPQWEQDAIRRLYLHSALTGEGYQEIYDLFRSENDLPLRKDAYNSVELLVREISIQFCGIDPVYNGYAGSF